MSAWTPRSRRAAGPGCSASDITLADVAVMPALVRMHDLGMPDWQDLPRVATWFDNIRAEPAFKPTYYSGSLLSGALSASEKANGKSRLSWFHRRHQNNSDDSLSPWAKLRTLASNDQPEFRLRLASEDIQMRRLTSILLIASAAMFFIPGAASASWTCTAHSRFGNHGWGRDSDRSSAAKSRHVRVQHSWRRLPPHQLRVQ